MRATSAKQRFPVPQWKADLEIMHDTAIKMSKKQVAISKPSTPMGTGPSTPVSSFTNLAGLWSAKKPVLLPPGAISAPPSAIPSENNTRTPSPVGPDNGRMSMGSRMGPGHIVSERQPRGRNRLSKPRPASKDSSVASTMRKISVFPLSGRSSRANSADRSKGKDKDKDLPAVSTPAVTAIQGSNLGISRISESHEEHHTREAARSHREVNFLDGNPFDDDTDIGSGREDSDTNSISDRSRTDEYILSPDQVANEREKLRVAGLKRSLELNAGEGSSSHVFGANFPSVPGTPSAETRSLMGATTRPQTPIDSETAPTAPSQPYLSLGTVLQGKKDFKLQNVTPSFDDPTGLYYEAFDFKLRKLNGKTSEGPLCIEEYIMQSEKDWFNRYRNVRLGRSAASSRASSIFKVEREQPDDTNTNAASSDTDSNNNADQFLLQDDYKPPTGLKKIMLRRIGTWPLYTFLLAFVSSPSTV